VSGGEEKPAGQASPNASASRQMTPRAIDVPLLFLIFASIEVPKQGGLGARQRGEQANLSEVSPIDDSQQAVLAVRPSSVPRVFACQ
jgi:hypothetical protein